MISTKTNQPRGMKCYLCLLMFAVNILTVWATDKNVHIRICTDNQKPVSRSFKCEYTDVYSGMEVCVRSVYLGKGVETMDLRLSHPIYNTITSGGRSFHIYLEPGDSIIVTTNSVGKAISYRMMDGSPYPYDRLVNHDISNNTFYTAENFASDKSSGSLEIFTDKILTRLNNALASVDAIAHIHSFTLKERAIAENNVKMQFGLWMMQYGSSSMSDFSEYARKHKEGWQPRQKQEETIKALESSTSYAFLKSLSPFDTTCIASRYYDMFLRSYEHSHYLLHDQYLYAGNETSDSLRMDSAMMAKDCAALNTNTPSQFMQDIMARRHFSPDEYVDDDAIMLKEVDVVRTELTDFYNTFGRWGLSIEDMLDKYWDPTKIGGSLISSPISYIVNHAKAKRYKKGKQVLKEFDAADPVRLRLLKAYEESTKEEKKSEEQK